jgi:hypothetical protein
MSNVMDSRKAHADPIKQEEVEEAQHTPVSGSVPVDVQNVVLVKSQKWADPGYDLYASYTTYILPASTASSMSIAQILPQDGLRIQAIIRAYNANVVLCKQRDQAQAVGNLQGTTGITNFPPTPQGFLCAPGGNPAALENNETLWAVNCDPTLVAYVTVIIERGEG